MCVPKKTVVGFVYYPSKQALVYKNTVRIKVNHMHEFKIFIPTFKKVNLFFNVFYLKQFIQILFQKGKKVKMRKD